MAKTEIILDYNDKITFHSIDLLLGRLKETHEFQVLEKSIRKRIYSILVECAENIYKYSADNFSNANDKNRLPNISLKKQGNTYIIKAGNLILNQNIDDLTKRLKKVNQLSKTGLKELYEKIINKKSDVEKDGAGLGIVTMALKADSKIKYKFTPVDESYSYFELQMKIN